MNDVLNTHANEVPVDPQLVWTLCDKLASHPYAQACRTKIINNLRAYQIQFVNATGATLPLSPDFADLVKVYWSPAIDAIVDCITVIGLCVVLPRKLANGNRAFRVPAPTEIEVHVVDNGPSAPPEYRVYSRGTRLRDALVITGTGREPMLPTGMLRTPFAAAVSDYTTLETMNQFMMEAGRTNARPVMVVTRPAIEARARLEGLDFDDYAEGDSARRDETNQFVRSEADIALLEAQIQLLKARRSGTALGGDASAADGAARTVAQMETQVRLREGEGIAHQLQARAPDNMVQLRHAYNEMLCAAMGVPMTLIHAVNGRESSNGVQAHSETFRETLLWWRQQIEHVLTTTYACLYGRDDHRGIVDLYMHKVRKLSEHDAKRDDVLAQLFSETTRDRTVSVRLPIAPQITTGELMALYQTQCIRPEMFQECMLRASGLPVEAGLQVMPPRVSVQPPAGRKTVFQDRDDPVADDSDHAPRKRARFL